MFPRLLSSVVLLGLLVWGGLAPCGAAEADLKSMATRVLEKTQPALVLVRITNKVTMGTGDSGTDVTVEVTGTVIDPSGLTVLSDVMADPMGMSAAGNPEMRARIKRDIVAVTIVLADGTELPSTCLLRDSDLDLAFVRPREAPAKPMACVAFKKPSAEPALLDDVIVVSSLGRAMNRHKRVTLRQVEAIVSRPRTYYVAGGIEGLFQVGSPVFTARGETLGFMVVRTTITPRGVSGLEGLGLPQPVILPAEAVLDIARQAAAVKQD